MSAKRATSAPFIDFTVAIVVEAIFAEFDATVGEGARVRAYEWDSDARLPPEKGAGVFFVE